MADVDAFNRNGIRALLKLWQHAGKLGAHELAQTLLVNEQRAAAGYADSVSGRGLALRDVLRACIDALKPPQEHDPDYGDKRWRPYLILTEQYINGRKPEYLAEQFGLVRGSFHQEQARALELLGDVLRTRVEARADSAALADADAAAVSVQPPPARKPFLTPARPPHKVLGRDALLDDLRSWLFGASGPRIALHGLPGAGKTALAVELANDRDVLDAFDDGVLWAGLGPQPDVLGALGMWAAALGLSRDDVARLNTVESRAAALRGVIGMRRMLLVIDDAWQLAHAEALTLGGPNCVHLVTMRQPALALAYAGEWACAAPELGESDGVTLLASHAPDAVDAHPEAAAALVQAVGGLPLALTLMGRRLRAATLGNQKRRVKQTLDALLAEFGGHDGKALADVIAASDARLSADEQAALRALALFPAKPVTVDEAAAVVAADCDISLLDALVDAGLLESDGERLTLHPTIADYARARLADPAPALRRVLVHYAARAAEAQDDPVAFDRDSANVLHLIDAAHAAGLHEDAAQMAVALTPWLEARGQLDQAERVLDAALMPAPAAGVQRAELERSRGQVARRRGDFERAQAHYVRATEALAGHEAAPQWAAPERAALLLAQCTLANDRGERERADALGREALTLARALDDARLLSAVLTQLAAAAGFRAQFDEAQAWLLEARAHAQRAHDRRTEGLLSLGLGLIASWLGDVAEGERQFNASYRLAKAVDAREVASIVRSMQGWVNANLGRYDTAEAQTRESLALIREGGFCESAGLAYANLGLIAMNRGSLEEAAAYVDKGFAVVRQIGHKEGECMMLNSLARMHLENGDAAEAERAARDGIQRCDALGYWELMPSLMATLGEALNARGAYDDADGFLMTSLMLAHNMRRPWLLAYANNVVGECMLQREDLTGAQEAFEEALRQAGPLGAEPYSAVALFGLARIAAMRGEADAARDHAARSLAIFERIGHRYAARVRAFVVSLR